MRETIVLSSLLGESIVRIRSRAIESRTQFGQSLFISGAGLGNNLFKLIEICFRRSGIGL